MTDKHEALIFADDRRTSSGDDMYEWAIDAEDWIRRLHAENETLRTGYAAARLEIESLRARSVAPAGEYPELPKTQEELQFLLDLARIEGRHTALGEVCAMRAAQQAPAPQPGAAGLVDAPEGWVTWWPSPSAAGHEPVYSHGPKEPGYGAKLDAMLRKYPVFAKPTTQPAPQQEPILYDPKALLEVFQTAQAGASSTAGTLRGIAAVIASWESRPDPHAWLIAAPQPSPAAQGDALDAARWHWLAEYLVGPRTDLDDEIVASETVNDLRNLVDAALAAQEGESHDN